MKKAFMAGINERMNVNERSSAKNGGSEFALDKVIQLQNKFEGVILAVQRTLTYTMYIRYISNSQKRVILSQKHEHLHVHELSMEIN